MVFDQCTLQRPARYRDTGINACRAEDRPGSLWQHDVYVVSDVGERRDHVRRNQPMARRLSPGMSVVARVETN